VNSALEARNKAVRTTTTHTQEIAAGQREPDAPSAAAIPPAVSAAMVATISR